MKLLSKLAIILYFAVLLLNACVLVRGKYVVEVNLYGYNNPTQTCQDCRDGGQFAPPGCCDRHSSDICNGGDRCDSYFYYCLRTIDSSGRGCSYFGNKVSAANVNDEAIDFINQSLVLGLENPLQLQGLTDAYDASAGIQLYIEVQDRDGNNADDFIDVILINHTSSVGIKSERQNHSGLFGFVTMDLSITVLCAENFQGPSCTECSRPDFTGANCNETDNCVGVDCGNGECVNGINSFSCACDPGYTGKLCDGMESSNLIGPVIGGVLGGLFVLLLLLLLIVMGVVLAVSLAGHCKSDEPTPNSNGQGIKNAVNQMYSASPVTSDTDQKETDTVHPLYEEVVDSPSTQLQYANLVSPSDSVLLNNPIYGADDEVKVNGDDKDVYSAPVDHYDNQGSSHDVLGEEANPTSVDKKHVYDYVDIKI